MANRDGRSSRWDDHRRERRQVVIDAAIELLEERGPGEGLHVQDIADRCGIHRTVIYRHFEDRVDLDLTVQREICERVGAVILEAVASDGTARELIHAIVDAYLRWAIAHPALISYVERDLSGSESTPFTDQVRALADVLEVLITGIVDALGAELAQDDRDMLDPFVFGLIGSVFQASQRWLARSPRTPTVEYVVDNIAAAVYHQVAGLATDRGITIPDVPISQLVSNP